MQTFNIIDLIGQQKEGGSSYLEFLRVPTLSVGVYALPAGETDQQLPHTEDEVYYIVSGSASILVGNESSTVEAGSIIFVAANVEHRFHTISEDLTILVFFAPAEYTHTQKGLELQA